MNSLTVLFKHIYLLIIMLSYNYLANATQFSITVNSNQNQNMMVDIKFVTVNKNGNYQFDTVLIVNSATPKVFNRSLQGDSLSYVLVTYKDCYQNNQTILGNYNYLTNQANIYIEACPSSNCYVTFSTSTYISIVDSTSKTINFTSSNFSFDFINTWYFGNGDSIVSSYYNANYTFPNYGTYNVCLKAKNELTNCITQHCRPVIVNPPGFICNPDFEVEKYTYDKLLSPIIYNNSNLSLTAKYWFFPNPSDSILLTSYLDSNKYIFPSAGVYNACLKMNDIACTYTHCKDILVGDTSVSGCKANFRYYNNSNADSIKFTFTSNASNTSYLTNYLWDFGDGQTSTGLTLHFYGNAVSHLYASPGNYNMKLTISDSACIDIKSIQLITDSIQCNASFYMYNSSPYNMMIVNNSLGNNLTYLWDFGDGNVSRDPFPTHAYQLNGSYTIYLEILDTISGCSSFYEDEILIYSLNGRSNEMTLQVVSPNAVLSDNAIIKTNPSIKLYPNPTKEILNITFDVMENGQLTILDLSGKIVLEQSVVNGSSIDVSQLNKGVYFASIQLNNTIVREKFLKQ